MIERRAHIPTPEPPQPGQIPPKPNTPDIPPPIDDPKPRPSPPEVDPPPDERPNPPRY
jgi:hypothetical protein